jgi:enoyl-CoA hydratase
LPRLIGKHKAFELTFTGKPISAMEAERIGLFNKVVAHEELESKVAETARELAGKSPLAIKYCREVFYRGLDVEYRKAVADAAEAITILYGSEDSKEGLSAFIEKREPRWKGR